MTIIALLQARNEERFIPGWLASVAAAVDGIVALDDGSADATGALLDAHPKVIETLRNPIGRSWNEYANQVALIKAGRRHGAKWFLCIDADERLEKSFVRDIREIVSQAEKRGIEAFSLQFCELWNDRRHFRMDGIWGKKARYRLFRNSDAHVKFDPRPLHRHWMPLELVTNLTSVGMMLHYRIYHLRMLKTEDRQARHHRYITLDPQNRFQPQGYDYLLDESGLVLAEVTEDRDFVPSVDPAASLHAFGS